MKLVDIHCPACGAPAEFDIKKQKYLCGYCGGEVGIREACAEKKGFVKMRGEKLGEEVARFNLEKATCTGCGAEVIFFESEAISRCAFCGRSLARKKYLKTKGLPEFVIPFVLTEEEAREKLRAWCEENKGKEEAKHLLPLIGEMKGFYLPYELVRGPVHMTVSRMDRGGAFPCEGFIRDEFVNRSGQLDNLLLDGMEPFDEDALKEFDFSYLAGQRVKISDISDALLERRVQEETGASYTPAVRKTLETKAVNVRADTGSCVRLPVLLPVYYIREGNLMAAVNGQTGKVSVRAEKESHYYFLPWWFKAILATLLVSLALFLALRLGGMTAAEGLGITGMLALIFLIVMLCLYSDTPRNRFSVESGRKIFTTEGQRLHREGGKLVQDGIMPERKVDEPVFFRKIEGKMQQVILRFTTPERVFKLAGLCILALFLPVILALFVNGFDFARLELGGSAVWFCIMVPVVPVYLIKFGIVELYDHPWVYLVSEDGKRTRYREKKESWIDRDMVKDILRAFIVPPVCLAVWFGVLSFITMVYLTAFGF